MLMRDNSRHCSSFSLLFPLTRWLLPSVPSLGGYETKGLQGRRAIMDLAHYLYGNRRITALVE